MAYKMCDTKQNLVNIYGFDFDAEYCKSKINQTILY